MDLYLQSAYRSDHVSAPSQLALGRLYEKGEGTARIFQKPVIDTLVPVSPEARKPQLHFFMGTLETSLTPSVFPYQMFQLQAPNIPKNKKRLPPKQQSFYFGIKLPPQQERC